MIESGRVLVIDDDPGTCHTISDVLELHGHAVESATDGYAGLERLTATPVDAKPLTGVVLCQTSSRLKSVFERKTLPRGASTAMSPIVP